MTWIIGHDVHARVAFYESDEDFRRTGELANQMKSAVFGYPEAMPGIYLHCGVPYPNDIGPFALNITGFQRPMLGLFGACGTYAVSQTAVDIIEKHEPGVHQYFPLDLTFKGKEYSGEPYYLLNVCTRLDCVSFEESRDLSWTALPDDPEWRWTTYHCKWPKYNEPHYQGLVIKPGCTDGYSLWFDWRLEEPMFSDALFEDLMAAGVLRPPPEPPEIYFKIT